MYAFFPWRYFCISFIKAFHRCTNAFCHASDVRVSRVSSSHLPSFSHSPVSIFTPFSFYLCCTDALPTFFSPPPFFLFIISSPLHTLFISRSAAMLVTPTFPSGNSARGCAPRASSTIPSPSNLSLPAESFSGSDSFGDLKYFRFSFCFYSTFPISHSYL